MSALLLWSVLTVRLSESQTAESATLRDQTLRRASTAAGFDAAQYGAAILCWMEKVSTKIAAVSAP